MFSLKVQNTQPENLLLTSPDGSFIQEVEVLRIFMDPIVEKENSFRKAKELSRSMMMYIHGTSQEVVSPMCYIDRLEYGRKLNNSGVQLCLL